jgi:predicted DCC family thiol-disulfide oxidoreductase YuxK
MELAAGLGSTTAHVLARDTDNRQLLPIAYSPWFLAMNTIADIQATALPTIIYDKQCPFCSRYVRLIRLRRSLGVVRLIDARDDSNLARELLLLGYNLDVGMLFVHEGQLFHGADAVHRIALLSTNHEFFNRLNAVIFRQPLAARCLYPLMKAGRWIALWVLGRGPIHNGQTHQ